MTGTNATTPASANSRATSPTRRMFSVRSAVEKPRSALRPCRRLSPSSRYAERPAATSARSTSTATDDFPDPDNPVNQTVAPSDGRSSRAIPPWCQTMFSVTDSGDLGRAQDDAGAHRVVGDLVDQDEAAGGAVAAGLVGEKKHPGGGRHPPDLVEPQAVRHLVAVEGVDVEPVLQVLYEGPAPPRRVLDRQLGAGPEVGVLREPADHRLEILAHMRPVAYPAQHVAAGDVDVVGEPHGHRHRREGLGDRA